MKTAFFQEETLTMQSTTPGSTYSGCLASKAASQPCDLSLGRRLLRHAKYFSTWRTPPDEDENEHES